MFPLRVCPRIVPIYIDGWIIHREVSSLKIPAGNGRIIEFHPLGVGMALGQRLTGVIVLGTSSHRGQELGVLRQRTAL